MNDIDDALLIAYIDGELAAEGRARVEAAVRQDPAVAARLAQHTRLAELAAQAFSGTLDEAAPNRLVQAVTGPGPVTAAGLGARRPGLRFGWPQAVAMAACLVIGLALGRNLDFGRPLVAVPGGGLRAGGALASTLERQLASQDGSPDIRVGLTFRSRGGGYCRTFRMSRESLGVPLDAAEEARAREAGWRLKP